MAAEWDVDAGNVEEDMDVDVGPAPPPGRRGRRRRRRGQEPEQVAPWADGPSAIFVLVGERKGKYEDERLAAESPSEPRAYGVCVADWKMRVLSVQNGPQSGEEWAAFEATSRDGAVGSLSYNMYLLAAFPEPLPPEGGTAKEFLDVLRAKGAVVAERPIHVPVCVTPSEPVDINT